MEDARERAREKRAYIRLLGEFVHEFAATETVIRYLLQSQSGLTPKKLEVFVGTPSIATCIEYLVSLNALSDMPPEHAENIAETFKHLKTIRELRDRLVHYGAEPLDKGRLLVSPVWKKRETIGSADTIYRASELADAIKDMRVAQARLGYHFNWKHKEDSFVESMRPHSLLPWRYIRPPQVHTHPPRKASRGSR